MNWNDEYQKRILTENEIYLASANQFNDPFDASYPFRYNDEDLTPDNVYLKLYTLGKQRWPNMTEEELQRKCYERQTSGVFEDGKYWKDIHEGHKEDINNKVGILSLTSNNENLLMWSHYTNSHRGFCVGLDKYILFEVISGQLGPVIYSNEFPKIDLFDESIKGITMILTTKSTDWEYEDEYRITKVGASRKIFKLPNEAIKEIVLGCNMPENFKNEIVALAREKFPNAELYQSQISLEKFKLDMIPILKSK